MSVTKMIDKTSINKYMNEYENLKNCVDEVLKNLLDPKKDFFYVQKPYNSGWDTGIKKSGFYKIITAFNISIEIKKEERDLIKGVLYSHFIVRASLQSGKFAENTGSCDSSEENMKNSSVHNIRGTARTRATFRAVAELLGITYRIAGDTGAGETEISKSEECFCDMDRIKIGDVDRFTNKSICLTCEKMITSDRMRMYSKWMYNDGQGRKERFS